MKKRKGQVLLIAVMLLATVITVVMTIAFNTTTETQVARLEADSQKALAAAEAGVEEMIKQSINSGATSVNIGSLSQFGSQNITGDAQITNVSQPFFVTPLLQTDEQYTLYLSNYPTYSNPWTGKIDIYLVSETGCPAIEVAIVKDTYQMDRYAYNACSSTPVITNALDAIALTPPTVVDSIKFSYKISTQIQVPQVPGGGGLVAFIKVLGGRTKVGFKTFADDGFTPKSLPIQGKTIESEARTAGGVVKKVQLFQSFPQIPSNFFMTSF